VARHRLILLALLGALTLGLVASACARGGYPLSQGTYPVDIFNEMHYSQAYRSQEPPRLSPPEGAVPVTGIRQPADLPEDREEAQKLADRFTNPLPRTPEVLEWGRRLYTTNCAVCHGAEGKGGTSTYTAQKFIENIQYLAPRGIQVFAVADLTSERIQNYPDVLLFHTITYGYRGMLYQGKNLLTEDERWAIVHYIRTLGGR